MSRGGRRRRRKRRYFKFHVTQKSLSKLKHVLKVNVLPLCHINLMYDHIDVANLIFGQQTLMAINRNLNNSRNNCKICDQNTIIYKVT
jgi:hypothetical protein